MTPGFFAAASAEIDESADIGLGTKIWQGGVIREHATLGRECVVGRNAYVDAGVRIGDRCKIQNHALLYAPAVLADGVFIGPAVVLTNDHNPRAVTPAGALKNAQDWQAVGVTIDEGASIGARSVVLGGIRVGRWALVGAGAVVTRDVPAHALVVGVPAKQVGWVGRDGRRLHQVDSTTWQSFSGELFNVTTHGLGPA
ncbi:MAG: acyltransferase [Actinomycetales bacterium]